MKKTPFWIALSVLALAALACNMLNSAISPTATAADSGTVPTEAAGNDEATTVPTDAGNGSGGTQSYDTEFPLPAEVSNFTDLGDGAINFQTRMSIKDALAFYQDALSKEGYKERPILTVTTASTFSVVFDGHKSGKAIVVQGVDLGGGNVNISIRLEAIQ